MASYTSLDIYDYSYRKVCNLYDSEAESPGAAHDIV